MMQCFFLFLAFIPTLHAMECVSVLPSLDDSESTQVTISDLLTQGRIPPLYWHDGNPRLKLTDLGLIDIEDLCKIPGIEKLVCLSLARNKLRWLNGNYFTVLENLEVLNLSDNRIQELDAISFDGLDNLTDLWLRYNELDRIESGWLVTEKLQHLDLTGNKIKYITPESLNQLLILKTLVLDDNPLTQFNPSVIAELPQLQSISLGNNQMSFEQMKAVCRMLKNINHTLKIHTEHKELSDYPSDVVYYSGASRLDVDIY